MYSTILVPVDLAHADKLEKSLEAAARLAKLDNARIVYCGVTAGTPGAVAHNPDEFAQKLEAFAAEQASRTGIDSSALAMTSHDPARDLDKALLQAIEDSGADLVVMASHVPGVIDHFFASNAGWLATHAAVSVMVVR